MEYYNYDSSHWRLIKGVYNSGNSNNALLTIGKAIEILSKLPSEMKIMMCNGLCNCEIDYIDIAKPIGETLADDDYKDEEMLIIY